MAKKKKKTAPSQKKLSVPQYLRERARKLPIDKCWVNADWQETGLANVIVTRKHVNGNLTFAIFVVDTYCRGVYQALYEVNSDGEILQDMISGAVGPEIEFDEVDYAYAHNLVYGAVEFAGEAGIMPCDEYSLASYVLEEDTDDVPYMEFEFGKDGKYFLVARNNYEASKYMSLLEKNLDKDQYNYLIGDDYDDDDDDDDDDDYYDDDDDFGYYSNGIYTYQHPDYPSSIELHHQWVQQLLSTHGKRYLTREEIDKVLALPNDELRHDLEQMALLELGRNANGEYCDDDFLIIHVLLLLAAVGDEGSLDVVMEIMRQDEDFYDCHICGEPTDDLWPSLHKLAYNNPRKILEYLKEPGLYLYFRINALEVLMDYAATSDKKRRAEILGLVSDFIDFLVVNKDDPEVFDSTLAAAVCAGLVEVGATELSAGIDKLFDTKMIDEGYCGSRDSLKDDLDDQNVSPKITFDIYKNYRKIEKWERKGDIF